MGSPKWFDAIDKKEAQIKELEELENQREQLSRDLGIDPEKSKWSTDDFHSEKTHKLALICYREFGKAFMEESINLLQAPFQIILHPLSTVENIYESLKMLPHLPEIIEQKFAEFPNLSDEEKCVTITRSLVSAGFFLYGSPLKAAAYKNLNLAIGEFAKATGASKILEKGEKVLRNGVERVVQKAENTIKWPWTKTEATMKELTAKGGNCKLHAEKIQSNIKDGNLVRIYSKQSRYIGPVYTQKGEFIASDFKEHFAIIRNGQVYDRITGPSGMELDKYKKLFEYGELLTFEQQ